MENTSTTYCDLIAKFQHCSSGGNQYTMVMYDYDSNIIIQQAIISHQTSDLKNAFASRVDGLTIGGEKPILFILDNKIRKTAHNNLNI